MNKHTPGPWKYGWETVLHEWAIVTDAAGSIVANVNTETGPDATSAPAMRQMPGEANARLIAAAPELLAACKATLRQCTDAVRRAIGTDYDAWTKQLLSALAKAEGTDHA